MMREEADRTKVLTQRLSKTREKLTKLAAGLETTRTIAADLSKLRELRLVIDTCKQGLRDA